jgi:uncharacterized Fe-S radical SAM superfamily protein PflX
MIYVVIKVAKKKLSKCKRCSLDCEVTRMMSLIGVPANKRKEESEKRFGNKKPVYTQSTCPKK